MWDPDLRLWRPETWTMSWNHLTIIRILIVCFIDPWSGQSRVSSVLQDQQSESLDLVLDLSPPADLLNADTKSLTLPVERSVSSPSFFVLIFLGLVFRLFERRVGYILSSPSNSSSSDDSPLPLLLWWLYTVSSTCSPPDGLDVPSSTSCLVSSPWLLSTEEGRSLQPGMLRDLETCWEAGGFWLVTPCWSWWVGL